MCLTLGKKDKKVISINVTRAIAKVTEKSAVGLRKDVTLIKLQQKPKDIIIATYGVNQRHCLPILPSTKL